MDPNPKPNKLLQQQTLTLDLDNPNPNAIDRISDLPDEIICHILSFLPTKYAAGTSILSRRWNRLFAFIPNLSLDFDDLLLLHPHKDIHNPCLLPIFATFIYSVMHLVSNHALRIYRFSLECQRDYEGMNIEPDYGDSHVPSWIDLALSREVRELTIQLFHFDNDLILFPNRLFHCSSVMCVTVRGRFFFDVPTSVLVPNLRRIFLNYVKFRNGESVQWLIRGCPCLEELCLERCEFEELEVLEISSSKLMRLVIINCQWDGKYKAVLDVPNLEVLRYRADIIAYDYSVKNLSCVREAHIDIRICSDLEADDEAHYKHIASGLVAACSNLEMLYLSKSSLHAIQWSWKFINPTFYNLTTLKLGMVDYWGWGFLPFLLESSPNLEVLELGSTGYEIFPTFTSYLTKHEPRCLSSHLQKVKIEDFIGDKDELNVVEFFLRTGKVLREIEINSYLSSKRQLEISKKLSLFPKRSPACEIVFTSTEEGRSDF